MTDQEILEEVKKRCGGRWDEVMGETWLRLPQLRRSIEKWGLDAGIWNVLHRVFHKLDDPMNMDRYKPGRPRVTTRSTF